MWLSVWSEVQIVCIWSSWCHCIPKPHHLLPRLNPDWFYLSGTDLPRLSWKRGRYADVVVLVVELWLFIFCVNVFCLSCRVLLMFAAKYFLVVKTPHTWHCQTRVICFSTTTALHHFLYKKTTSSSHHFLPGWLQLMFIWWCVNVHWSCIISENKLPLLFIAPFLY